MRKSFVLLVFVLLAQPAAALTLQDMRDEVRVLAMDTGSRLRFSTSTIDDYLNQAQKNAILEAKPIRRSENFELVAGTTYYDLAADRFFQLERVTVRQRDIYEITPVALARKSKEWENSTGLPTHYFIDFASRTKVGFYPVPESSASTGTVRYSYYALAKDLSAASDEPFDGIQELGHHHYLLVLYAAFRLVAIDGRADLAALYRSEYAEALVRLKREAAARPSYRPGLSPAPGRSRVGP